MHAAPSPAHPGPAEPSAIACPAALHRAPAARPPPPSSPPFCLFRAFVSSFLLLLFVIWPIPLRALDFDGRPDRIAGASATSARPRPSSCPSPAAAAAAEAAPIVFCLFWARVNTTLPPPVPSPNSRDHVIIHASRPTYPTHVSIRPWAPPDPRPLHVPRGHAAILLTHSIPYHAHRHPPSPHHPYTSTGTHTHPHTHSRTHLHTLTPHPHSTPPAIHTPISHRPPLTIRPCALPHTRARLDDDTAACGWYGPPPDGPIAAWALRISRILQNYQNLQNLQNLANSSKACACPQNLTHTSRNSPLPSRVPHLADRERYPKLIANRTRRNLHA